MKLRIGIALGLATMLGAIAEPAASGEEQIAYVLWTVNEEGEVWRANTQTALPQQIREETLLRDLIVDLTNGKVYWDEQYPASDSGAIWRSNLDGSARERLLEIPGLRWVNDFALDMGSGKLYWAEISSIASSIRRANLDGSNPETLVSTGGEPRGLDLDLTASPDPILYYAMQGSIRSANLDGSNDALVLGSLGNLVDIAVDGVNGKLYFTSAAIGFGVRRCNLDGSDVEILVNGSGREIDVSNGRVYWVGLIGGSSNHIRVMDLDGGNQEIFLSASYSPDGFHLDHANSHAYFVGQGRHSRIGFDGSSELPVIAGNSNYLHGVAGFSDGTVFFADFDYDQVVITDWGGKNATSLVADPSPLEAARGLAIDAAGWRLFWVTESDHPDPGIRRADLDGGNLTDLVTGESSPHDVALDLTAGMMYWTENVSGGVDLLASIRAADLDGNGLTDVLTGLPQSIRGIEVDPVGEQLFWTDHGNDMIMRSDLDGMNAATLHLSTNPHDLAIDPVQGKLYWTEGISSSASATTGKIRRSNLDGSGAEDFIVDLPALIRDISIVLLPGPFFADGFESGDTGAWSSTVGGS